MGKSFHPVGSKRVKTPMIIQQKASMRGSSTKDHSDRPLPRYHLDPSTKACSFPLYALHFADENDIIHRQRVNPGHRHKTGHAEGDLDEPRGGGGQSI
jgi:hypothetical protein